MGPSNRRLSCHPRVRNSFTHRGLSSLLVCYNLILEFTNLLHCKKKEKKKEATVVVFSFLCVSNISPPQQRTIHVKHVVHPTTLSPQYRCGSISVMTWTHHHRLIWRETGDLPATPPKLNERKQNNTGIHSYLYIYILVWVCVSKNRNGVFKVCNFKLPRFFCRFNRRSLWFSDINHSPF